MKNKVTREYDEEGNIIYAYWDCGHKSWMKYDENNRIIYFKNSVGEERYYKYKDNKFKKSITKQEFKQIERARLLLNNKKISRFSLMDI